MVLFRKHCAFIEMPQYKLGSFLIFFFLQEQLHWRICPSCIFLAHDHIFLSDEQTEMAIKSWKTEKSDLYTAVL